MPINRRKFLKGSLLWGSAFSLGKPILPKYQKEQIGLPAVISTWNIGMPANEVAWSILKKGGRALDAVEAGVRVVEADPGVTTVGYGATPDREGQVTLDACIMDEFHNAGSVCYLQHIKHPVSVARKVMEKTPHVILAGEGALRFALENGFKKEKLLTRNSRKRWRRWKKNGLYKPVINIENHDTIGMLALDQAGNLSGACTTSGIGFKMPGRVGDSPIIGAGLYVDNEVGAATATGLGELVLKTLGSFLIVELMRQGKSPEEACREAIRRIVEKTDHKNAQVGFIAINKAGETGGYSLKPGFGYSLMQRARNELLSAKAHFSN